jgi:glycosyltransferase involved in cell wall biosynthesis
MRRCGECLKPWIAPPRWPAPGHIAKAFGRDRLPVRTVLARAQARLLRPPDAASVVSHVERYHASTRDIFEAVDLFVSPSRFLAREFERYGLPPDRLLFTPNGIDTRPFAGCGVSEAPDVVRFGFMGSWMPSKGLHVLVEAFRGLTENARLVLFGGPPAGDPGDYARGVLGAAADRRVTVVGRVSREQVASAFAAIDVLVVPSLWYENAPLTIQEAFAARVPVVASRSGGMAEAVRDGVDGLLFATGSVADLRATLRRIACEPESIPVLSRRTSPVTTLEEHASALEAAFQRLRARATSADAERHAHTARHP